MYTTTIIDQQTGEPTTDLDLIGRIAQKLGSGQFESDDPELGIWYVDLSPRHERAVEANGVLDTYILGQRIFIEMP